MKLLFLIAFFTMCVNFCFAQEKVSQKVFEEIALVNKIEFNNSKFDQARFSCGFLLKHNNDTFAITAKHLLKIIKPDNMKTLSFENVIKTWSLYPLGKENEIVITNSLLNENNTEVLDDKGSYTEDWLAFSIKANHSKVKALTARTTPLVVGEKLYVIGWTRRMESGDQRVYEFEYLKTIDNRILLKDILVPEQFGGLSGAPLVDEQGAVVGIVSNGTVDPATGKKHFSPCTITGLISFIANYKNR